MSGLRGLHRAFFSTVFLITLLAGKNFAQTPVDSLKIPINAISSDSSGKDSTTTFPVKAKAKKFLESVVKYNAKDSSIISAINKKIYLYGNASIDYTSINLKADYIEIDMNTKTISARGKYDSLEGEWIGKPLFTDKDKSFTAEEMSYNFETKKGIVKSVITQEGEGYLHAEKIKYTKEKFGKDTLEVIFAKGGKYTTCNLEEPHFHIRANKIKVIKEKKIITGPANFVIESVPTPIFLPFGYFPTQKEKASGLIFPQYGIQPEFGFFLKDLGFYWAASPKLDLAVLGSIYTNGSFGLGFRSQYKIRYKVAGALSLSYKSSVFGTDPKITEALPGVVPYRRLPNWQFTWQHTQDPKWLPGFSFKADVQVITSGFNKLNQLEIGSFVQNNFNSRVSISYMIPKTPFNISVNVSQDQNINTGEMNLMLPEIILNTTRFFPFKNRKRTVPAKWWQQIWEGIGITHNSAFGNGIITSDSSFSKDLSTFFRGRVTNGIKHSFQASNSFKLFKYINFNPSLNYIEYWDFKHLQQNWNNQTQQIQSDTLRGFFTDREWDARVDLSTNIFGFFTFKKGKVKAIRQVITPNVYFSYNPNFQRDIIGYYGQNGTLGSYRPGQINIYKGPNRGPAGLIGFNLTSNMEMKVESKKDTLTGIKKIKIFDNITFNGAYNLIADSLNLQPFNLQVRNTFLNDKLSLVFNASFDPYSVYSDTLNNRVSRVNTFEYKKSGRLVRLTMLNLALSYAIVGKPREQLTVNQNLTTPEEQQVVVRNPGQFLDFNVPYNLIVSYNFAYSRPLLETTMINTIGVSGDFSITKNWKIDFVTGFDFNSKKFALTSIGINRNLHCWQMDFKWIPFGSIASYVFTIRAKASLLQDLKLNRKSYWAPSL